MSDTRKRATERKSKATSQNWQKTPFGPCVATTEGRRLRPTRQGMAGDRARGMIMWTRKIERAAFAALILTLGVSLSGCGSSAYREVGNQGSGSTGGGNTGGGSNPGGGDSGNDGFIPAVPYDFDLSGAVGPYPTFQTPAIPTDTILKVRISALPPVQALGVGYTPNFSCARFTISANGKDYTTPVLKVNGGSSFCPNAVESAVIDLSERLAPGTQGTVITVKNAYYDEKCYQPCYQQTTLPYYPYYQSLKNPYVNCDSSGNKIASSCQMTAVYSYSTTKSHIVAGRLEIMTNGGVY